MEPIERVEELFAHQRAVRTFSERPVDDETVRSLIEAAIRAPSSQNGQRWQFIVIRDIEVKRQLTVPYEESFQELYGGRPPARGAERTPWTEVPVLIAACFDTSASGRTFTAGASIYPACQNLMLKARSLGLGTVLTTLFRRRRDRIHEILGVPDGWEVTAIIPVGWADRPYGKSRRPPAESVIMRDRWSE